MRVIAGRGRSRSGQAPHGSPQRPVRRVPEACGGTHAAYASRPPHDVAIDRSRGGDPPREVVANAGMPPGGISPRRSRRSRRSRDRVLCLSPFRFVSLRSSFIVLAPDVGSSLFALRSSLFALRSSLFALRSSPPMSLRPAHARRKRRAPPPRARFPASPLPRFPASPRSAAMRRGTLRRTRGALRQQSAECGHSRRSTPVPLIARLCANPHPMRRKSTRLAQFGLL
ncbi:periplasmic ligand binding lipoprotein [Burkholderia pseudomallei]|nr:periplasmic ligand binding lipoprotein [Burkholderia pseudomallei]CAJ6065972.1 periplasmic ligand binding lipoprotein [Burkholderia pseudomallei]VBE66376.1 periplasmic ligand binding lipoprotein [Burkholderia pseudomallei]VBH14579.1 periplasmic ligand binding lipoprotein [Burkholderia pseudomallei]